MMYRNKKNIDIIYSNINNFQDKNLRKEINFFSSKPDNLRYN